MRTYAEPALLKKIIEDLFETGAISRFELNDLEAQIEMVRKLTEKMSHLSMECLPVNTGRTRKLPIRPKISFPIPSKYIYNKHI